MKSDRHDAASVSPRSGHTHVFGTRTVQPPQLGSPVAAASCKNSITWMKRDAKHDIGMRLQLCRGPRRLGRCKYVHAGQQAREEHWQWRPSHLLWRARAVREHTSEGDTKVTAADHVTALLRRQKT